MEFVFNTLWEVKVKDKTLKVVYDKRISGLHEYFSSDKRIREYIHNNTEEALYTAINCLENNNFILNIASTMDFGAFSWKNNRVLLCDQLECFYPIINKFIELTITEELRLKE